MKDAERCKKKKSRHHVRDRGKDQLDLFYKSAAAGEMFSMMEDWESTKRLDHVKHTQRKPGSSIGRLNSILSINSLLPSYTVYCDLIKKDLQRTVCALFYGYDRNKPQKYTNVGIAF